jgi:hypothetical protein
MRTAFWEKFYKSNEILSIGLLSLIWLILRTGLKPSRAAYPCQRAAMANSYLWLTTYVFSLIPIGREGIGSITRKKLLTVAFVLVIIGAGALWNIGLNKAPEKNAEVILTGRLTLSRPASDIFVVKNTSGNDGGGGELVNLMGNHGLLFYKSTRQGTSTGPTGLIASDDVIIVKVNSQWDERGGTNTDLLKALLESIVKHPDGFTGEIIVADNGQAQYGASGIGGSLSWSKSNAEDHSQSVQKVVDMLSGPYKVSTYLWDAITTKQVNEYDKKDMEDGYVVNSTINPRTKIMVSYPKFRTKFGTYVSFKLGVYDAEVQTYNSEKLKVINVPVLKSHSTYGVTASVKSYMGVLSDKLTNKLGARSHNTVDKGGMGTEMVETRFPILSILDGIWVNAVPGAGPRTPYNSASRVNVVAASTDPIALDYWAAKHILVELARNKGYSETASMDPDNADPASFGNWLRLSMQEMKMKGYETTCDESLMNIYVTQLQSTR